MTEDRRAHERIDALEGALKKIADTQATNDAALRENTELTRQLVANTQTLVDLVRGARWVRGAILWLTPIIAAVWVSWGAIVDWAKAHLIIH